MLVLFWELLQCNKRFRSFIIDTDRAHDFIVLVLYYAMEAKDDPARQGIVRMCVFILQTLSVERFRGGGDLRWDGLGVKLVFTVVPSRAE